VPVGPEALTSAACRLTGDVLQLREGGEESRRRFRAEVGD